MPRAKLKADNRADTRGGGWAGIPHVVIDSPAYRSLSLWARAVFVEIVREFNGYNNGEIAISISQLCERLGNTNRGKAGRAIAELMDRGLIDVAAEAMWKERLAREYRLTFVSVGNRNNLRPATNDYRAWQPRKKNGGNDALPVKAVSGHTSLPEPDSAGNDALPDKFAKLRKSAISEGTDGEPSGNDASPLIY